MWLGVDLGTGSVKARLYDAHGDTLGEGRAGYAVDTPREGWSEADPEAWWHGVVAAVRAATDDHATRVRGVGLSGQMHGVVLTDAEGLALRPAVLWPDRRSEPHLEAYRALGAAHLHALANPLAPGMAGPALLWLRDHEPEPYRTAAWALQPKDWLRFRLVGEAAADPSDASATLLYDVDRGGWHEEVVLELGLRRELLAPIRPSASRAGIIRSDAAAALGLPEGVSVATGAADTAAAILGSGLGVEGVQLTVGTGGQIVHVVDAADRAPGRGLHLFRSTHPGRWYRMAAIQNAGLALEWVRSVLALDWDGMYSALAQTPPGSGGLVFLPYLTGERTPYVDPGLRAGWLGASSGHTRNHFARAAFEGVAFALADAYDVLLADRAPQDAVRLAGGGSTHPAWRQLLADVLRVPLEPSGHEEASVRGAAMLAAAAEGETLVAAHAGTSEGVIRPSAHAHAIEAARAAFREAVRTVYGERFLQAGRRTDDGWLAKEGQGTA